MSRRWIQLSSHLRASTTSIGSPAATAIHREHQQRLRLLLHRNHELAVSREACANTHPIPNIETKMPVRSVESRIGKSGRDLRQIGANFLCQYPPYFAQCRNQRVACRCNRPRWYSRTTTWLVVPERYGVRNGCFFGEGRSLTASRLR